MIKNQANRPTVYTVKRNKIRGVSRERVEEEEEVVKAPRRERLGDREIGWAVGLMPGAKLLKNNAPAIGPSSLSVVKARQVGCRSTDVVSTR